MINKPIAPDATARALSWQRHTHNPPAACSNLVTVLQQAHQHVALVVLATKKHFQHLDFPLFSACAKPIRRNQYTARSRARWQRPGTRSSPRYATLRGYGTPPVVFQSRRDECTMDVADCYNSVNRKMTGPCQKQLHPCACNRN